MIVPASPCAELLSRRVEGKHQARARPGKGGFLRRFCGRITGILFLTFLLLGHAQASPSPQANADHKKPRKTPPVTTSKETIHVSSPLVVVPFTVTDSSGEFVYNVHEDDVRVLDDGVPQHVTHFAFSTRTTAAVIVVQANQKANTSLGGVRPLGLLFSDLLLGRKGRAAVISYSGKVTVLQNFSGNPSALKKALQRIHGEGNKARLNDALARAVRMLAHQMRAERRVIIVFSDGIDRGSATRGKQVIRAACDANVQIYGLRFQPGKEAFENGLDGLRKAIYPAEAPPGAPASVRGGETVYNFVPFGILAMKVMRAELRKNRLAAYSEYTGGSIYTPFKVRSFQNVVQQIALDINSEYVLTYVPDTLKQKGFHRITIEVSRPRLSVHARSGYFYEAGGG